MALHRYWRITDIVSASRGGAVELAEFQLLDGTTRVDAAATVTSNVAPTSGSLSSLKDNSLASVVSWANPAGLTIDFDCGSAVEVNNFKMGTAGDAKKFFSTLSLLWSDDGVTYTALRRGDYYAWPGAFAWTRNTAASVVLRSAGTLISQGTAATLAAPAPPLLETGDLLVTALVRTATPTTPPSGWTQIGGSAGPAGAGGSFTELWGKVAVDADKGVSTSWPNTTNVQMFAISAGIKPPTLENHSVVSDNLNVGTKAIPVVTSLGQGRMGLTAANWTLAFTSGNTDMTIANTPPWVRQFVSQAQLRLGVATFPTMQTGDTTAGTWSTTATGSGGGWGVIAAVFAGAIGIESSPFTSRGIPTIAYWPPVQAAPSQVDMGKLKSVSVTKLRRNFIEVMRGQGIGRINGTTKDKASPNIPVSERVVLFRQRDCAPIREVVSTPGTGAYTFDWIDETEVYFVVSFDHDGTFRAVIADGLVPDKIIGSGARAPALLRGSGAMTIANSTTVAVGVPTGAVVGDLLVATIFHRSAMTPPAGWVLAATTGAYSPDGVNNFYTDVFTKVAEAGDLTGPTTFTQASSGAIVGQAIAAYSSAGTPSMQGYWYNLTTPALDAAAGQASMPTVTNQTGNVLLYLQAAGFTYNGSNVTLSFTGANAGDNTRISTATATGNQLLVGYKSVVAGDAMPGTTLTNSSVGTHMWGLMQFRIQGALLP